MTEMKTKSNVNMGSGLIANSSPNIGSLTLENYYNVECFDKDGNLKWTESFANIVVDVGINDALDKYFKGSAYTAAWYVGLKNTGTPVAGDTMAVHGTWTENVTYTEATRPALTLGTVAAKSVDNSASKAVFSINGTTTIFGAFIVTNSTKSGTTGILYGVGDFASSRAVVSGDTLNVTITLQMA